MFVYRSCDRSVKLCRRAFIPCRSADIFRKVVDIFEKALIYSEKRRYIGGQTKIRADSISMGSALFFI